MVSCNAPRSSLAVYSAGIEYSCIWSAGAGLHPWHCSSLLDAELGHPQSLCAGREERRELPPEGEPLKRSDLPSGGWSLSSSLQGLCREPRQAGFPQLGPGNAVLCMLISPCCTETSGEAGSLKKKGCFPIPAPRNQTLLGPQHLSTSPFVVSEDLWALFYSSSNTLKL